MKVTILAFSLISFNAFSADLSTLQMDANMKIDRQMKALENSKTCINRANTQEEFRDCNYDAGNFLIQKEEVRDTATTTERVKTHGTKKY